MSAELPDYKRANRTVPCPYCGALAGQPCRTPRGRATYDHGARSDIVGAAFRIGIEGGLRDALGLAAREDAPGAMREIRRQYDFVRRGNLRREAEIGSAS